MPRRPMPQAKSSQMSISCPVAHCTHLERAGATVRNSFRYQELPYPPLPYGKVTNWSRNALAGSVSSR